MLQIEDFARRTGGDGDIAFGLDAARFVEALRRLADDVETGLVMPDKVEMDQAVDADAYATRRLTILYRQKIRTNG